MSAVLRPGSPPRQAVVSVIVVAWIAVALLAETLYYRHGGPLSIIGHDWIPGASWTIAGLVAWRRRPDVVIGKVMIAIGFCWYIGGFGYQPVLVGMGTLLSDVDLAIIVWLVFAYPSGRIERLYERVYAAIVISWIAVTHVTDALLFNPPTYHHCDCTDNAFAIFDNPDTYDTLRGLETPISTALAAGMFVLLTVRYVRLTPAARRALTGLWVASVLLAAFEIGNSLLDSNTLTPEAFQTWAWVKDISYAAIPIAFAAGLRSSHTSQGRIGRLVDQLAAAPEGRAQTAIAAALGDPSAEILFYDQSAKDLVDAQGHPRETPIASSTRSITPITHRGETLGVLIHDPVLDDRPELVTSVCAAAGMALSNERLTAQVRAQLADVRASRSRLVQAGDAERRRIERNLHDGAQQRLVATRLNLQLAVIQVTDSDPALAAELTAAAADLDEAIGELRALARGIHPTVLTDQGLAAAVDSLTERAQVPVRFHNGIDRALPSETEAAAYYVVAEALTNVGKYANANRADIEITRDGDVLVVQVSDDGTGGAVATTGSGLSGLHDRVAAAGGRLTVSSPPGQGTILRAILPIPSAPVAQQLR